MKNLFFKSAVLLIAVVVLALGLNYGKAYAATLTITKKVVGGDNTASLSFPVYAYNSSTYEVYNFGQLVSGQTVKRTVSPGNYYVWEIGYPDYEATYSSGCFGNIYYEDGYLDCVITNTYISSPPPPPPPSDEPPPPPPEPEDESKAKIRIQKKIDPYKVGDDPEYFNFVLENQGSGPNYSLKLRTTNGSFYYDKQVEPGKYNVKEVLGAGWIEVSNDKNCLPVTVEAKEHKECFFVNTKDTRTTIKINKTIDPYKDEDDGKSFTFSIKEPKEKLYIIPLLTLKKARVT